MSGKESIKEDQYPVSWVDVKLMEALSHWSTQRHYQPGISWDGIEKFHLNLASVVDGLTIEVPLGSAWYDYPSGHGDGKMAGKDWRYIIADPTSVLPSVVNCHSMVHDDSWSLVTSVYSTSELGESNEPIHHYDPWVRAMLWTIELATLFQTDGYDFTHIIEGLKKRAQQTQMGWKRIKEIQPYIKEVFEDMFGRPHAFPDYMLVVVADWDLPEGKIASYNYEDKEPWGQMTISPKAFKNGLFDTVVKHELCHAALGKSDDPHGEEFQRLANRLGVPQKYQD